MLKSLLVAIDETKGSQVAQDLSIALAKRLGASIKGLAVLDKPWIEAPRARPIGTGYYHEHRVASLRKSMSRKLHDLVDSFDDQCETAKVSFELIEKIGAPVGTIEEEAQGNDLIVVGKDTTFHFAGHNSPSDTVVRLIRDDPRPIILTSSHPPAAGGGVLIAYDGSLSASHALHMFVLLGLAKKQNVTLLCVDKNEEEAKRHAAHASALLSSHGIAATVACEVTRGAPASVILDYSSDKSMVVMGAFSNTHLRDYFFGSTTQKLLEKCLAPLFVHH